MYYGLKWPCGADDLQQPHLVYIYDSCPRAIPPHGAESGLAGADSLGIGANGLRRSDAHRTRAKGVFISASAAHTSRIRCSPNWRIVSSVSAGLGRISALAAISSPTHVTYEQSGEEGYVLLIIASRRFLLDGGILRVHVPVRKEGGWKANGRWVNGG